MEVTRGSQAFGLMKKMLGTGTKYERGDGGCDKTVCKR